MLKMLDLFGLEMNFCCALRHRMSPSINIENLSELKQISTPMFFSSSSLSAALMVLAKALAEGPHSNHTGKANDTY